MTTATDNTIQVSLDNEWVRLIVADALWSELQNLNDVVREKASGPASWNHIERPEPLILGDFSGLPAHGLVGVPKGGPIGTVYVGRRHAPRIVEILQHAVRFHDSLVLGGDA